MARRQHGHQVRRLEYHDFPRMAAVGVSKRRYCRKSRQAQARARAGSTRLGKWESASNAYQGRSGRYVLADDISNNVGRRKTAVCRWHDPGGLQGDGKHSRLEWRHHRELRACRRDHNRKSINIRARWPRLPNDYLITERQPRVLWLCTKSLFKKSSLVSFSPWL